jgi:nucleoside phosphorylase
VKVLVTFAVEAEFAPWRKRRGFEIARAGELIIYCASLSGVDVNVLLTGIGDGRASVLGLQVSSFTAGQGFDVCISSGLAGALRAKHVAGDLLVAKQVRSPMVHADVRTDTLACDEELVCLASECGARPVDSFYMADHIVITSAEKARLSPLADAVDMESFEVIKEARACGSRAVAIRAISDTSEEDLPVDLNLALTGKGHVSLGRIAGQALRHPKSIGALLKFGRQSQKAAEALADFLERYVQALAHQGKSQGMQEKAVQA